MERRTAIIVASSTPEVERDWLRFDILTDGTILWKCSEGKERTISYRKKNSGKWIKITSTTSGALINVTADDIIEFKGNNTNYGGEESKGSYFAGTATFNVSGNISTMLGNSETLVSTYSLAHIFTDSNVVSAEDLILPYTTLTSCCYYAMFKGCTALTEAPELPAMTLAEGCYAYMFYGCTSLVEAPELPATTLVSVCYQQMFYGCSELQYIRALFTTTPSTSYTENWVSGVAAKGVYDKGSATYTTTGSYGIPSGWLTYSGLVFIVKTAGTILWRASQTNSTKTVQYSINSSSSWTSITSSYPSGVSFNVSAGDVVLLKGSETRYSTATNYNSMFYRGTARFDVVGNIMSLLNDSTTFSSGQTYAFCELFCSSGIISARYLRLPVTTLTNYCYYGMLQECYYLIRAPKLPATALAEKCYGNLFYYCTSLTESPKLSATTLANSCYYNMFGTCRKLTKAPELPATTLANNCYEQMFGGCTSLTKAPELPVTILADSCYKNMFNGCTSLTKAPELPATTLANGCYQQMFYGCSELTIAPDLSATSLVSNCYYYMFYGCSNLNEITCLATDISASSCISTWVENVAESGTFTKAAEMTSWPSCVSGIPENWTVEDYVEE